MIIINWMQVWLFWLCKYMLEESHNTFLWPETMKNLQFRAITISLGTFSPEQTRNVKRIRIIGVI